MSTTRKAPLAETDELDVEIEVELAADGKPARKVKPRSPARRRGRPAHMVAARVGLTTGALYHHFGSKRELYLAVFEEVEEVIYDRFRAAADPHDTFVAKVEAVLDETGRLSTTDPTLAGFALSVTGDLARHPDLQEAVESAWARRDSIFAEIVAAGVATGEVAAADRRVVLDLLVTMVGGLIAVGAGLPAAQSRAVKGYKRLLAGTLMKS
jgi:TetR/AcrR family transcriptional regulator, transcriptional repressor for nem operon